MDHKALLKKSALASDTDVEISEPTVFTLEGRPVIFYGRVEFDVEPIRKLCLHIKYQGGERASGLKAGDTRCFGAVPRDPFAKTSPLSVRCRTITQGQRICFMIWGRGSTRYTRA